MKYPTTYRAAERLARLTGIMFADAENKTVCFNLYPHPDQQAGQDAIAQAVELHLALDTPATGRRLNDVLDRYAHIGSTDTGPGDARTIIGDLVAVVRF